MTYFVEEHSIVRLIWRKSDTVLLIFAGAAAEFALNKAVDWLYFTGRLPADPLGRLFSTVGYARKIVFSEKETALAAIDQITSIHKKVEESRGSQIPDWAYRDVLFMLVYYSIAAFELLERPLTPDEKEEVYHVFYRVGHRMGLKALPLHYPQWLTARQQHLQNNLEKSEYSKHLYQQYKKHLGPLRYFLLLQVQTLLVPSLVKKELQLPPPFVGKFFLKAFKWSRQTSLDRAARALLFPAKYKPQIRALDIA